MSAKKPAAKSAADDALSMEEFAEFVTLFMRAPKEKQAAVLEAIRAKTADKGPSNGR